MSLRRIAPPLLVWLITAGALAALAWHFGYDPLDSRTWSRWDSEHYERIARSGYNLYPCRVYPGEWCGEAGWFPGYSWLVRTLHLFGLPLRGSAVAVAWVFSAATLVLLWNTFLAESFLAPRILVLVFAAWAPGQIYNFAVFPLSLLAFCTVAHLWLLHQRRYVAAGVAGAGAVLTYPLGVLLIPVSAAWLLGQRGQPVIERLRHVACTSGIALAGVAILVVDQKLETGHWDAYLLVQNRYGHAFQNPAVATWHSLHPLLHGTPFQYVKGPALQTAVVTAAMLAVLAYAMVRRRFEPTAGLLALWAVVVWLFPLTQTALSLQRSQAALLPAAVLLLPLARPLQIVLICVALAAAVAIEYLFLHGVIV
jgi:hypothetical protein